MVRPEIDAAYPGVADDWPITVPGEVLICYPPDDRPARGRTNVYFVYDANRELLDVGQTGAVRRRLLEHRRRDPWWWELAAMVLVMAGNSRDEADQLEQFAIGGAHPAGNRQHRKRRSDESGLSLVAGEAS